MTELLRGAVTLARDNRRQDRTATLLAILVTAAAGTPVWLSGHSSPGGAYLFGAMAALAAVGGLSLPPEPGRPGQPPGLRLLPAGGAGLTLALLVMGVPPLRLLWGLCAGCCVFLPLSVRK